MAGYTPEGRSKRRKYADISELANICTRPLGNGTHLLEAPKTDPFGDSQYLSAGGHPETPKKEAG